MSVEENLKKMNIQLPEPTKPVGAYLASKKVGNLLFISGQVSIDEKGVLIKGKLGEDLTTEQGYIAAKRCALSIIAHAKSACKNDLSKIISCVKLTGYVNSINTFTEQPKVINGASEITSIFGDIGMHARVAVSTNGLPLGVAVEIDAIFEVN